MFHTVVSMMVCGLPFCCVIAGAVEVSWDDVMCVHTLVKYVGSYHGLLSGVTVRPGSVEPHSVVECLYACREGLDFGDLETLGSGMKVTAKGALGCQITHLQLFPSVKVT